MRGIFKAASQANIALPERSGLGNLTTIDISLRWSENTSHFTIHDLRLTIYFQA
jgi:hypothetical protein